MNINRIGKFSNLNFKANSEIEIQTKQAMRDNMNDIEKESIANVSKVISGQYLTEFEKMIQEQNKKTTTKDIKIILESIQKAYSEAGLSEDANALGTYINTLG